MARTRPSQTPRGAAAQIEAFLRSDPAAPLTAAVGFASVRGLAWLAERTAGRRVTLVIGDCRSRNFEKADDADRELVRAFLARRDVEVKNWYQKHPKSVDAHLKVWIARTKAGPRALVGSANLTGAGLFHNWEMVVEPTPSDLPRVVDAVDALVRQAWDVRPRLEKYIHPGRTEHRPKEAIPSRRTRFTPDSKAGPTEDRPKESVPPKDGEGPAPSAAKKGCLPMLVKGSLQMLRMLVFLPALWLALLLPLLLMLIGAGALVTDGYPIDAGQPPDGLISPIIHVR